MCKNNLRLKQKIDPTRFVIPALEVKAAQLGQWNEVPNATKLLIETHYTVTFGDYIGLKKITEK